MPSSAARRPAATTVYASPTPPADASSSLSVGFSVLNRKNLRAASSVQLQGAAALLANQVGLSSSHGELLAAAIMGGRKQRPETETMPADPTSAAVSVAGHKVDAQHSNRSPPPLGNQSRGWSENPLSYRPLSPLSTQRRVHAISRCLCSADGDGLRCGKVRHEAIFTITATDKDTGEPYQLGSDAFFIGIRGASRVRARVIDNADGTYTVQWKPSVSGEYSIAVAIHGVGIAGSPFAATIVAPCPVASKCTVIGDALTHAVARAPQTFEVHFQDALGDVAYAEDLDVYVEPLLQVEAGSSEHQRDGSNPEAPNVRLQPYSFWHSKVEIGPKPLIVRASVDLNSEQIGQLQPGQLVRVLDECNIESDGLRALVELVDDDEGTYAVLQSWAKNDFDAEEELASVLFEDDPAVKHKLLPGLLWSMLGDSQRSPQSTSRSHRLVTVPESDEDEISSQCSSEQMHGRSKPWRPRPGPRVPPLSHKKPAVGAARAVPSSQRSRVGMSAQRADATPQSSQRSNWTPQSTQRTSASAQSSQRTRRDDAEAGAQQRKHRQKPTSPTRKARSVMGWITVRKAGIDLVRRRERLDASDRHMHMQQWARRTRMDRSIANEKLRAKQLSESNHDPRMDSNNMRRHYEALKMKGLSKHPMPEPARKNIYSEELKSDPSGVGFAFGGVEPGTAHAKGRLHKVHKVSYSVGAVGVYRLHVCLRNQALPLPGSPWTLTVSPGPPYPFFSTIEGGEAQMQGSVGSDEDSGCYTVLRAADKLGNWCTTGGAKINSTCMHTNTESIVTDCNDGTYRLSWRSTHSGTFVIHVQIDGQHVTGSPSSVKFTSTKPEIASSKLSGEGLRNAVAGVRAEVVVNFVDSYANMAVPPASFRVCMALLHDPPPHLQEVDDLEPTAFEGGWSRREQGEYTVAYRPTKAGKSYLHLWCEVPIKGSRESEPWSERVSLPGSPLKVLVVAGKVSVAHSQLGALIVKDDSDDIDEQPGSQEDGNGRAITSGDTAIFRPRFVDCYLNIAEVDANLLEASITGPDGRLLEAGISLRDYSVKGCPPQHEVRHQTTQTGLHILELKLDGTPIPGSPIQYPVLAAPYVPLKSVFEDPQGVRAPGGELYVDHEYTILVRLRDRFGNYLDRGGAKAVGRLEHEKQGLHDSTVLTSSNHNVTVVDNNNGTYMIKLLTTTSTGQLTYFPMITKLFFILGDDQDNDFTRNREMPQLQLRFQKMKKGADQEDDSAANRKSKERRRSLTGTSDAPPSAQRGGSPSTQRGGTPIAQQKSTILGNKIDIAASTISPPAPKPPPPHANAAAAQNSSASAGSSIGRRSSQLPLQTQESLDGITAGGSRSSCMSIGSVHSLHNSSSSRGRRKSASLDLH